ncbi:aspartate dehydrogenase [Algihabitans albus]|uniref:aspartate dehydrogenase n=1 Tax=Algihabitans albus TaxID=2164067 RepID=UPI001ABBF004|nr:aspartate dehydrogenase [Algihabitans albus]
MLRLAMIGYGPIARFTSQKLAERDDVEIGAVLCRPGREAAALAALGPRPKVGVQVADLDTTVFDVALDCAGHGGLAAHGPDLLRAGLDVITLSVGALADAQLTERLNTAARAGSAQLELASGAIGGIDALTAARIGGLREVSYRARKPPAGWKGTAAEEVLDLDSLAEPTEHFRGPARAAALRYPQNANVAAIVALAGLGLDDTEVRLIADPSVDRNRHEIEARGAFGRLQVELEGAPLADNPKSSALAAMSLVSAVERRLAPLRIG